MDEEMLMDEAARLLALSRQGDGKSHRLYRGMALRCCLEATERRADRLFPEKGRRGRKRPSP